MLRKLHYELGRIFLVLKIFKSIVRPPLYKKVLVNSVKNFLRKHSPSSAVLGLTYRCQCHCVHCSAGQYEKNMQAEMNTQSWLSLLDDIDRLGVPRVNLSGGEALLREDIFEIVEHAAKKFVLILESNGQLLSDQTTRRLKQAGLSCVAISIDSASPDIHNRLRGLEGCFQRAIEGIMNCKKNKLPCFLSTYIPMERANYANIHNLMKLAKNLGVLAVRVLPPRPVGSFSCHLHALLSKEEEDFVTSAIDPYLAYFKGMPAPSICGIFTRATFYISPYGQLQPCPFMPLSFGNIQNHPLSLLLDRMWSHRIFDVEHKDCLALNETFRNQYFKHKEENINACFPVEISS